MNLSDRICFSSAEPVELLAGWLATLIYEGGEVPSNVPWLEPDRGQWWELSRANDHKLDVLGDGHYAYRDRYHPPARMARIAAALASRPGVTLKE